MCDQALSLDSSKSWGLRLHTSFDIVFFTCVNHPIVYFRPFQMLSQLLRTSTIENPKASAWHCWFFPRVKGLRLPENQQTKHVGSTLIDETRKTIKMEEKGRCASFNWGCPKKKSFIGFLFPLERHKEEWMTILYEVLLGDDFKKPYTYIIYVLLSWLITSTSRTYNSFVPSHPIKSHLMIQRFLKNLPSGAQLLGSTVDLQHGCCDLPNFLAREVCEQRKVEQHFLKIQEVHAWLTYHRGTVHFLQKYCWWKSMHLKKSSFDFSRPWNWDSHLSTPGFCYILALLSWNLQLLSLDSVH